MKKHFYIPVLVALLTATATMNAQPRQDEYLGLPGDNLNLYAVMKLFQESETLEGFERQLNDENSRINNLDLNSDGYVDYIRVIDNIEKNVHYIVLQVAVNARESQDVAVFTVIQQNNGDVLIQLIGDEALYGRNYIIEPIYDETPNPGYTGTRNSRNVTVVRTTTYEVAAWPVIRFIYTPTYVVWHSPWYYNYYPVYWRAWSPFYWHYYYGYHYNHYHYYYGHYRHYDHPRYEHWHDHYYTHQRSHSPYVRSRIDEGHYKSTYSHPEQRREGVALYRRTVDQNRSASSGSRRNTSVNASGPRSGADANRSGTNTSRTGTSASGRRSTTSSSAGRDANTTRSTTTRQSTTTRSTTTRESSGTPRSSSSRESAGTTRSTTTRESTNTSRSTTTRESTGTSARRSTSSGSSGTASPNTRKESSAGSQRRTSSSDRSGSTSSTPAKKTSESRSQSSGRR